MGLARFARQNLADAVLRPVLSSSVETSVETSVKLHSKCVKFQEILKTVKFLGTRYRLQTLQNFQG